MINNNDLLKIPDGVMILPDNEYYMLNSKKTYLNNNVLICGVSGSRKTTITFIPNMLEGHGSYVAVDYKGRLYKKYHKYMQYLGYDVKFISFTNPNKKNGYNPLLYIRTTQDIQKITYNFIGKKTNKTDDYWDDNSTFLINSVISYLYEKREVYPESCNIPCVIELLRQCGRPLEGSKICKYLELLEKHRLEYPDSWAVKQYENIAQAPNKTYDTIVSNALSKFSTYDTEEMCSFLSADKLDFRCLGQKPTIIFVEVSDTDRSTENIVNLFFTQAISELCIYADSFTDGELPCPVRFMLDDFPSIYIKDIDVAIANIRSRKISLFLVIQNFAQLKNTYGENAETIIDNCDTLIFTGTNSPETARQIGLRCNKSVETILRMPLNHSWIFRRGSEPKLTENFNLDIYMQERHPYFFKCNNMVFEK